jgi:hypothetical protein
LRNTSCFGRIALITKFGIAVVVIISALYLGVAAGVLTAIIRLKWQKRVIEELVSAVLEPETVSVAQVSWTAAALLVAVGLAGSYIVAQVGVPGPHDTVLASVAEPLVSAACVHTCLSAGGGGAGGFVAVLMIGLIVFLLVMLCAVGIATTVAVAANGLVIGGVHGAARELAIAVVLVLTRLWTTRLTDTTWRSPPGRLSVETAIDKYLAAGHGEAGLRYSDWMRREGIARRSASFQSYKSEVTNTYLDWLRARGMKLTADSLEKFRHEYLSQSTRRLAHDEYERLAHSWPSYKRGSPQEIEQRPLRKARWHARDDAACEEAVLAEMGAEVGRILQERDPTQRMAATNDAPAFNGSQETFFYQHWLRDAVLTGVRTGACAGLAAALLAILFVDIQH